MADNRRTLQAPFLDLAVLAHALRPHDHQLHEAVLNTLQTLQCDRRDLVRFKQRVADYRNLMAQGSVMTLESQITMSPKLDSKFVTISQRAASLAFDVPTCLEAHSCIESDKHALQRHRRSAQVVTAETQGWALRVRMLRHDGTSHYDVVATRIQAELDRSAELAELLKALNVPEAHASVRLPDGWRLAWHTDATPLSSSVSARLKRGDPRASPAA